MSISDAASLHCLFYMPDQTLIGPRIERPLTAEHGREEYWYAPAVQLEPVETMLLVEGQLVPKMSPHDAGRTGVGYDDGCRVNLLESFEKYIELVAAKLVEYALFVAYEWQKFLLLGLPVYEEVDMLEMRFANLRHLVHALKECVFLVDEPPDSNAGVDVFRVLGDIVPAIKCFRLNLFELRPTHNRTNTPWRKRRIHADKQEAAVLEVVIKDRCVDIVAYAEMLLPHRKYFAVYFFVNHRGGAVGAL